MVEFHASQTGHGPELMAEFHAGQIGHGPELMGRLHNGSFLHFRVCTIGRLLI